MTLVLCLIMNDGFSFDSAGDRRQNSKPKFAQVPEQSEFTYSAYLVAALVAAGRLQVFDPDDTDEQALVCLSKQ